MSQMTNTASIQALISEWADQLQALLQGDTTPEEFHDQTGLDYPEIYECLNEYVANVNYTADTYNLGGDQVVHLPAPPPVPPGSPAAVYETVVNNYQQNIVNDYSTEVNQIFNNDGDVNINQAVAGAGGIANTGTIDDSVLAAGGGDVTFGDNTAIGNEGTTTQTGDVTASDGSAVNTGPGGTAETTGSGNDFGSGDGTVNAVSDSTDVNQSDVDVDITGTGGGNAAGGAGGDGGAGAGGAGGAATGGADSDGVDDSPVTVDVKQDVDEPEPPKQFDDIG